MCQDVIAYSTGSLSRITFHYPPTFSSHDIVLIISRSDTASCHICIVFFSYFCSKLIDKTAEPLIDSKTCFRFLRTKKDRDRYKFKQDEVIVTVVEGKVNDRRESKQFCGDIGYLSYGTV